MNAPSNILSFDPGELTGVSFVRDGEFEWGIVATPHFFQTEVSLTSLYRMTQPTFVVIETPPGNGFPNADQTTITNIVNRFYRSAGVQVAMVNPGQWKGMIDRSKISGTHVQDATDMARWFYKKMEMSR